MSLHLTLFCFHQRCLSLCLSQKRFEDASACTAYSEDRRNTIVAVSSYIVHWHNAAGQHVLPGKTWS